MTVNPITTFLLGILAALALSAATQILSPAIAEAGPAEAGRYAFQTIVNPESNLAESYLLDTSNGTVFTHEYSVENKKNMWKLLVSPDFLK